jgi:hypothetical protein
MLALEFHQALTELKNMKGEGRYEEKADHEFTNYRSRMTEDRREIYFRNLN